MGKPLVKQRHKKPPGHLKIDSQEALFSKIKVTGNRELPETYNRLALHRDEYTEW